MIYVCLMAEVHGVLNYHKFRRYWIVLFLLFAGTFFLYDFDDILNKRPQGIHQSRQSDCASYTLNYYQNDRPFLKPQTHTLTGKDGNAASEFPILYYFTAQLYKLFGPHEYLLRVLNLIIFYLGLCALFALSLRIIRDPRLALLPPILVLVSPYIIYYANNFLPNVPSLSLVFMGWWAFYRYRASKSLVWWVGAVLTFLLAALLKIPAAISFVVLGILWVMDAVGWMSVFPRGRKHWVAHVAMAVVFAASTAAWYMYARWYNEMSGTGQNLLGLLPIWNLSVTEIRETLNHIWVYWKQHYLLPWTTVLLFGLSIWMLVKHRRLDRVLKWILFWMFLGVVGYSLLWYVAFRDHDYYLINLFVFPVFLLITFLEYAKRNIKISRPWIRWTLPLVLTVFIGWNLLHVQNMQNLRYHGHMYSSVNHALFTMDSYLEQIGVGGKDTVMVLDDFSPNISLYLINRFGWTEAFTDPYSGYNIYHFRGEGMRYLIVPDSSYLSNQYYQPFYYTKEGAWAQIGEYKGVLVFDISYQE